MWPGLQAGIPLGCRRCAYPGAGCVWLSGRVCPGGRICPGSWGMCIRVGAYTQERSWTVGPRPGLYALWCASTVHIQLDVYGPVRVCIPVGMHMAWGCPCGCVSWLGCIWHGGTCARVYPRWMHMAWVEPAPSCSGLWLCVFGGMRMAPLVRVYPRDAYARGFRLVVCIYGMHMLAGRAVAAREGGLVCPPQFSNSLVREIPCVPPRRYSWLLGQFVCIGLPQDRCAESVLKSKEDSLV